ncbi:MAG: CCA tRNA nucleotidyltransferase [Lachnospiraceae bacterium]|nr:CCA tRNA nucleotidyltransferase [Lachnospiraceae bacterium]
MENLTLDKRIKMPDDVISIIKTLNKAGFEAYAVGGCVRDCLLKREVNDWDITTIAEPYEVKRLFKRTIDTGLQHGTVTVLLNGSGYEVTTYRVDGEYTDGRHPKEVTFTKSLTEDLKRRDFTINAMAYNDETGIIDEFDGISDLENKVIRCVGNPDERFTEDYLRIMRAVRFSAQLGFEIEEKTLAAIKNHTEGLKNVSWERIRVELTKLITSDNADRINVLYETGILDIILPELTACFTCEQNTRHHIFNVGEHIVRTVMNMNFWFEHAGTETVAGETETAESAVKAGETETAESVVKTGETETAESAVKTGETETAESVVKAGETETAESVVKAGETGNLEKTETDKNVTDDKLIDIYTERYISKCREIFSDDRIKIFKESLEKIVKISDEIVKNMTPKDKDILAVAMLFHDMEKPACLTYDDKGAAHFYKHPMKSAEKFKSIGRRLTYDNYLNDHAKTLIYWHDYRHFENDTLIRRTLARVGIDNMPHLFLVQFSDIMAQNPDTFSEKIDVLTEVWQNVQRVIATKPPVYIKDLVINGKDLIQMGIKPGPKIGEILEKLIKQVIDNPERNTREYLLKEAENFSKCI